MDAKPQANHLAFVKEDGMKRELGSSSQARSGLADVVVMDKKGKRAEDDSLSPYSYYATDAEDADIDSEKF